MSHKRTFKISHYSFLTWQQDKLFIRQLKSSLMAKRARIKAKCEREMWFGLTASLLLPLAYSLMLHEEHRKLTCYKEKKNLKESELCACVWNGWRKNSGEHFLTSPFSESFETSTPLDRCEAIVVNVLWTKVLIDENKMI